jgi:hypothetical protein
LKLGILQFQPRGFGSHDGRAARVPVTQRSGGKTQQKNRRKKKEKKKKPRMQGGKVGKYYSNELCLIFIRSVARQQSTRPRTGDGHYVSGVVDP